MKRIKFLAKSKVSSFRLARFTEAFELFEELEVSGEFPCDYIGKLLAGIQRYDLVEKLGTRVSLPGAERGLLLFLFRTIIDCYSVPVYHFQPFHSQS